MIWGEDMLLTSMDITNKEFKKVIRGYDSEEVDEFLEKIAEDYEELYKENSALKEQVFVLKDKIEHFSKMEDTIQNTLLLAQNAADQAKQSSQKEAELIIKNANDSAQRILDKANNNIVQVNEEYERIKQEFIKFRAKFRNFMNTQMDTFNSLESDFVKHFNVGSTNSEDVMARSNNVSNRRDSVMINENEDKINTNNNVNMNNNLDFKVKDIDDDDLNDSALNDIKSFFAK